MSNTASIIPDSEFPRIIISAGEPAGIGPDLIVAAAQNRFNAELTVAGDPDVLMSRARLLQLPLNLIVHDPASPAQKHQTGQLNIFPIKVRKPVIPGKLNIANAAYVMETISNATLACLRHDFAAMVTAPVHKAVINEAGYSFSGHTEFIAALCSDAFPVMMLMNSHLRVALVSTHVPLVKVPAFITANRLQRVISTVHHDLRRYFAMDNPQMVVCGLNPHAGEAGHLGDEEIKIIIPVLEKLRSAGMQVTGPVPADTAFTPDSLKNVDVVISMYHDQGLPALKSQGFGETVNITLGLPIIRTSVDHGTALPLAGTGNANPSSMQAAIEYAIELGSTARQTVTERP